MCVRRVTDLTRGRKGPVALPRALTGSFFGPLAAARVAQPRAPSAVR